MFTANNIRPGSGNTSAADRYDSKYGNKQRHIGILHRIGSLASMYRRSAWSRVTVRLLLALLVVYLVLSSVLNVLSMDEEQDVVGAVPTKLSDLINKNKATTAVADRGGNRGSRPAEPTVSIVASAPQQQQQQPPPRKYHRNPGQIVPSREQQAADQAEALLKQYSDADGGVQENSPPPRRADPADTPPTVSSTSTKSDRPKTPPSPAGTKPGVAPASSLSRGVADPAGMEFVHGMMRHAWGNYVQYAWGQDELKPVSKRGKNWLGDSGLAATIVDSLDTLYIMGMFAEFERAKEFAIERLDFNLNVKVSLFETVIRVVGGLLSAYDLCGDYRLVEKTIELADRLLPAFNTPTGIPNSQINLATGESWCHTWTRGALLSEYGSLQLEFVYLSDVSGVAKYGQKAMAAMDYVVSRPTSVPGLYPIEINNRDGEWQPGQYALGAMADSFYEYLLKIWLISDKTDSKYRALYDKSARAIHEHLVRTSSEGLVYVTEGTPGYLKSSMEHLTCFAGGMFAMGAITSKKSDPDWKTMFDLGANITETCYMMYHRQPLHIGAERTDMDSFQPTSDYYILRPEVVESIFYMWRLTHDEKYRKWGMEIAEAIEKWCRTPNGYSGVEDVTEQPPRLNDVQESFFLAETLKYLYLLFTDDTAMPLDLYVFNTEAHPLSVRSNRRVKQSE